MSCCSGRGARSIRQCGGGHAAGRNRRGSGSGKSTLSYALVDSDPDTYEVLNLDDYQKLRGAPDLPRVNGPRVGDVVNWDHPDVIRWDDLLADLKVLRSGAPVTLDVWAHRSNPDYAVSGRMKPRTVHPRPVVLLEGYLALHDARLRAMYSRSYYLDLDDDTRARRRAAAEGSKNSIIGADAYDTEVLLPMHRRFVEPTRSYADVVLDVGTMSAEEVLHRLQRDLRHS